MGRRFIRILLIISLLLTGVQALYATHQRAGEISYTYISDLTYEFTIVIPVYIGQDRIDEIIVKANNRVNYMSGGH